jgi:hypothetical protein
MAGRLSSFAADPTFKLIPTFKPTAVNQHATEAKGPDVRWPFGPGARAQGPTRA